MQTLHELARLLNEGQTTSRALVERCLDRLGEVNGEGARIFRTVGNEAVFNDADAIDKLRRTGRAPSRFAGIPASVKDLFDVQGEVTCAGSRVLADTPAATQDASVVARLRAAGFVIIGRTNMTEFAFSGLGINPHYGTPLNPYDRVTGRIPGGSSSGAAVSVTDGMAAVGLGTDTGGSCRIPAAMCGIVGFKPTARRVALDGVTPLSFSLDSVGSLAQTVACCAVVDSVVANEPDADLVAPPLETLRLGALQTVVLDRLEPAVARRFEHALHRLSACGVKVEDVVVDALVDLPSLNAKGGLAAAEAYAYHRNRLAKHAAEYDPRVRDRIMQGKEQSAAEYIELMERRRHLIAAVDTATDRFDGLVYPTTPIIAPSLASLAADDDYERVNLLALRNTSVTNLLDRCAVSVPIHEYGAAPVGLNVMGCAMEDRRLLAIASSIEAQLSPKQWTC